MSEKELQVGETIANCIKFVSTGAWKKSHFIPFSGKKSTVGTYYLVQEAITRESECIAPSEWKID